MDVYAVNTNNEIVAAASLQSYLEEVMTDERLVRLGFNIAVSPLTMTTALATKYWSAHDKRA